MLYTPKYIYNNDLEQKICKCPECKKYRILYCHSSISECKEETSKSIESDIFAVCSKCGRMYRFSITQMNNQDKFHVVRVNLIEEKYSDVKENIIRNYNSYESILSIKSEDFLTKLIKDIEEDNYKLLEYVFMEK